MTTLISIGGAKLRTIGLRPIRLSRHSEARFPARPTWYDMDYQSTGLGERTTALEAETLPHVLGGMDAVALLEAHHLSRQPVQFIRLAGNFLALMQGLVVIRALDQDEEKFHPADGVGRVVRISAELVHVDRLGVPFGGGA